MFHSRILSAKWSFSSFQLMAKHDSGKSGNGRPTSVTSGSARSSTDLDLAALEERLGHHFRNRELLNLALSHASIGAVSNERLEFLGDRVLGLIVAERLYADYPGEAEGGLAVRLNALVRREACAKAGEAAGLAPYLIMASSESGSGGRGKSAILPGACGAGVAGGFLDGGVEAARRVVLGYLGGVFSPLKTGMRAAT